MIRYLPFALILALAAGSLLMGHFHHPGWYYVSLIAVPLVGLGIWDLLQADHSLMRLYPVSAHFRWFFEWLRPYMREYLLNSDDQGRPFNHQERALVYKRAKDEESAQAFGTDLNVYSPNYEWINHAIAATREEGGEPDYHVMVGGDRCSKPYSASVLNISAMSFGALSGRAIEALNYGASLGGFAHNTGEGGISTYHLRHGGDLIWQVGTGYFGCRAEDGGFDAAKFRESAATEQVRMIEVKLSQGAKPGHGGLLPAAKVTPEIAAARGVPGGEDVLSPPHHTAFSTPTGMLEWIAELREMSGGKPVGFKLCIGHHWEFLAIVKAMLKTGITPDFITVDGAEGGTGAAPAELANHVGTPLREGLVFVVNALIGAGLRDKVRVAAAGKVFSGHTLAANMALGADWCNAARSFMFSIGCVQTKKCHTDRCPTGVATQDRLRQRAIVVGDKGPRVHAFHRNTMKGLAQYVGAAGLKDPAELKPHHLHVRLGENQILGADRLYGFLEPGALREAPEDTNYAHWWALAQADSFEPRILAESGNDRS